MILLRIISEFQKHSSQLSVTSNKFSTCYINEPTRCTLTLEGPCIIFCNIYTFQRDTQCGSTDCLLMLRCQLYMFRTVTVHHQELLFRCCMCRLWYVVRNALPDTSRWYNVWGRQTMQTCLTARFFLIYKKFISWFMWNWVAAFLVSLHCVLLPFSTARSVGTKVF